jgi:hypothetical protein
MQLAVWLYERSVVPLLGSYEVRFVVLFSAMLFDGLLRGVWWHCSQVMVCKCTHAVLAARLLLLLGRASWLRCGTLTCSWWCGCMRGVLACCLDHIRQGLFCAVLFDALLCALQPSYGVPMHACCAGCPATTLARLHGCTVAPQHAAGGVAVREECGAASGLL